MNRSFISLEKVGKSFNQHKVLTDITLSIEKGEIAGLIGPNGAGKTTLIRLINGVIDGDYGQISVAGFTPSEHGDEIRKISGILTEGAGLYHGLSGMENLRFFASLYGNVEENRILDLLQQFGLWDHREKLVGEYSTGMKKRLGLARALLHRPHILFLDEPTNGLDPEGIHFVMETLQKLNKEEGTTILLCSHVLHQMAEVCHRFIFLDQGKIIENGTLDQLERNYLTEIHLSVEVESTLQEKEALTLGYPVQFVRGGKWLFTLPNKEEISPLLTTLLQKHRLYSAEITNRDLESLYFKIREEEKK